jgi:hypothetical protein
VNLFDTHKFAHVIACGARAAEEQVPYLRQLLGLGQQTATQATQAT